MKFVVLFLAIMIPFILFGQDENAEQAKELHLSLQQARDFALEHNTNVLNAQLDVLISKKKVWETTAVGLPQIKGGVSYNNYLDMATQLIPGEFFGMPPGTFAEVQFGTKHNATASLTASQLIFSGEYIVGLQAAKIFKQLSEESLLKNEYDVTETVTQTYFLVLMAEENKKILEKSITNTAKIYEEMKRTNEVGLIENISVDQLKLTLKNLENSLNSMERQLNLSKDLFKVQLGLQDDQLITLTDSLENILDNIDISSIISTEFVLDNQIDFRLLETQQKLSELELKRQKSTFLPTVSAFFTHQQNAMRNDFNFFDSNEKWFPTTIIGAQIEIPIFGSGMKMSKVQQAKLEVEKVINTKNFIGEQLEISALQSKSDLKNAFEKYENEKENLNLAERIYNEYLVKFKNGTASSIELTQAQNQYLTTQGNYISSMVEVLNAKNKLDKAFNNYSK